MTDVRSVDERLSNDERQDRTQAHELLGSGMRRLGEQLYAAFPVKRNELSVPYHEYGDSGGRMRGSLVAYTGEELDWVIDSWIASPAMGFCNHHLTVWLPASTPVPHIAFAVGTIPEMFVFMDLVPRSDLWVDLKALDTYYEPFNERFMSISADPAFKPFVSRAAYIREAISPIGICKTCEPTEDNIQKVFSVFGETLRVWSDWVKDAPPVAPSRRRALARRDTFVRRTVCERDPANIVAEKVLGPELTDKLVRVMWGAERSEA